MAGDGGAGHTLAQWPSLPVPGLCHPGNGATELAVTEEPGTQVLAEGPWVQSGRLIHVSLCVICLPSSGCRKLPPPCSEVFTLKRLPGERR